MLLLMLNQQCQSTEVNLYQKQERVWWSGALRHIPCKYITVLRVSTFIPHFKLRLEVKLQYKR